MIHGSGQAVDRALAVAHATKELRARVAELELCLAKAWRPIETAPKDGTPIIIYEPAGGIFAGEKKIGDFAGAVLTGYWWKGDELNKPKWRGIYYRNPTHWQPFPDRPR